MRVVVVRPDARWAGEFESESRAVAAALGDNCVAIHHIGSTSVPGLWAKPIIDMLAEIAGLAATDAAAGAMVALGYEAMGELGIPGRRYFRKSDPTGVRTHHVHAFEKGSPGAARHLAFRDYLRAHPTIAAAYGSLKRDLAAKHPHDIQAYMDGKDGFIKRVEAEAMRWVDSTRSA